MARFKDDGAAYLTMYPELADRWINRCCLCHRQGYKPDMPDRIGTDSMQANVRKHLMAYFAPLPVNEIGICAQCARHYRPGVPDD